MNLKNFQKIQKKIRKMKGFTLVELIIVITIISILGTIAFISFTGYSQNSRDSKRIADIGSIQKSLEIYITEKGTYPIPDNNANIIYSGSTAWIEGTVGDSVIKNIENISKKPLDPLTGNEYTYSITSSKTEYQIGAISEGGQMLYKLPINQTHAASKKEAKAMIRGTYNGRFLKVQSGTLNWILALPNIIVTDISQTDIQTILNNKNLVHNNYSNLPHSYNNMGYIMTGGFEYTNINPLIYSGTIKTLADDNNEKLIFISNLKAAYSGTILQGDPEYIEIVNLDTEINQTNAVNLVNNYINSKIGGLGITGMQIIPMSSTICASNYREENGVCIENIREGVICQGLPTNAIWNSTGTITQTWNGSDRIPSTTVVYNTEASTEECRYKCDTGYHTEDGGLSCITNIGTCAIANGTGLNTWNGTSRDCTVSTCDTDYYNSGDNTCSPVGIGYYSNSTDTTRTACTNYPDNASRNYTYTSDGGGTNSCTATYTELCGLDLYESVEGTCSAVGVGYYSPASENSRTACTNYPDNASRNYTYTSDGGGANACTATYTELCGLDLYESAVGTCSAVGVGYYSPASENSRTACTNYPDNASRNYTYTSDGGGTNACTATYTALCGIDLYESAVGTCSAVGIGYYSPAANNTRYACTNKPSGTYTSDGGGSNSCHYQICYADYIEKCNCLWGSCVPGSCSSGTHCYEGGSCQDRRHYGTNPEPYCVNY